MAAKVVLADIHLHNWSAFATPLESGQFAGANSRLVGLLSEIKRAAKECRAHGGRHIIIAGDLFHVRGSVAPSVLNPTLVTFRELIAEGFEIDVLPGNHDLEGKHSTRLGNAVMALEDVGVHISNQPADRDGNVLIPWFDSKADFETAFNAVRAERAYRAYDVFIHAPIDGALPGLNLHGFDPKWLETEGCRVFAGHYHNHKDFGNGVYSIGALAHHTWSDVGSKAGFLIVEDDKVTFRKSHLPEFVDLKPEWSEDEMELAAQGNYVRIKLKNATEKTVAEMREWMGKAGALGVIIQPIREPARERDTALSSVKTGASIEASVAEYVKQMPDSSEDLQTLCQNILAEASVA